MFSKYIIKLEYEVEEPKLFTHAYKDRFDVKENALRDLKIDLESKANYEAFKPLLGADSFLTATKNLAYVDQDYLTMYYILHIKVKPTKQQHNAFYFGCYSNQHHLATATILPGSYVGYGADIKGTQKLDLGVKPIRLIQGFDKTGNLGVLGVVRSIINQLDADIMGDLHIYVSDIHITSVAQLYNSLIIAMRTTGISIMRMPPVYDVHTCGFILLCIHIFKTVEIFKAPWNGHMYIIGTEPVIDKLYHDYIKYLAADISQYLPVSNEYFEAHANILVSIKDSLIKLTQEAELPDDPCEAFVSV